MIVFVIYLEVRSALHSINPAYSIHLLKQRSFTEHSRMLLVSFLAVSLITGYDLLLTRMIRRPFKILTVWKVSWIANSFNNVLNLAGLTGYNSNPNIWTQRLVSYAKLSMGVWFIMNIVKLEGITLMADDVARLARFYQDVLGFEIVVEEDHYVEFRNNGVRLAICSKSLMSENTNGYSSFRDARKGQAVELNFQCDSPDQVYALYDEFISKGAIDVTAPQVKSWGHTTGFFGDPEGNVHSLFAVNPV